jgi:hypothetical protein
MPRTIVLALVFATGCGSATPPPSPAPDVAHPGPPTPQAGAVEVLRGATPVIDGRTDDAAWSAASGVALGGNELRIVHDGANVYLAVSRPTSDGMAFGCVFVADSDRVSIFHASAQLGTAVYTHTDGAFFPASKEYAWRDAATMQKVEGWHASTVGPETRHQEFALSFERLGQPSSPRRIAFGYIVIPRDAQDLSTASTVTWPAGLTDGVADPQMLGGFNPDAIHFAPSSWALLHLAP